jgi:hypothetical protein
MATEAPSAGAMATEAPPAAAPGAAGPEAAAPAHATPGVAAAARPARPQPAKPVNGLRLLLGVLWDRIRRLVTR